MKLRSVLCLVASVTVAVVGLARAPEARASDARAVSSSRNPAPLDRLRTTNGAIAIGNLEAQIEGEKKLVARGALTVKQRAAIADLTSMHGQFTGTIKDYEDAEQMAESLVRDAPEDALAYITRAKTRATFHRFPEALIDLQRAEELGLKGESVDGLNASILQATGHYDEALAIRKRSAARHPDISSLAALASVHADRGELDEAERLFNEAPLHYRDVSPFPVVWLYFQQGLMWMRAGKLERARELFEGAHERLPIYAAAQGHLGEVEAALHNRNRAVDLLRPLAARSDDPDYSAQLARILLEDKQPQLAAPWRAAAEARYNELTVQYPAAFADHAAEFWLAAGDPVRALKLAMVNLEVRKTPAAYELVIKAAVASHDPDARCEMVREAQPLAAMSVNLEKLLASAGAECGPPQTPGSEKAI